MLTQERVKELIEYSLGTGDFFWKVSRNCVKQNSKVGSLSKNGYIKTIIDGKSYLLHRVAFLYVEGMFPIDTVDHINGVRSDNRWCNLRKASQRENSWNSKYEEKILPRNVSFVNNRNKPFRVTIHHDGKIHSYGYYSTVEEANLIAINKRKEIHGNFCVEYRK